MLYNTGCPGHFRMSFTGFYVFMVARVFQKNARGLQCPIRTLKRKHDMGKLYQVVGSLKVSFPQYCQQTSFRFRPGVHVSYFIELRVFVGLLSVINGG